MKGTTEAVRNLLIENKDVSAAEAVSKLIGHNPATVRTQIARQRRAIIGKPRVIAMETSTLNLHKVVLCHDTSISEPAFRGVPDEPYAFIVLQSGKDARFIKGEGGSARKKLGSLKSSNSVTDNADRTWVSDQGGCLAMVFIPV
ncbi:hypothetical protein [Allomesorhizobium camelthorni]|uniref:Uncharacterized protein n=1 Tax=Allomesorhizobium camelthorni TaxID=475069 RepID=A0A6G4WG64_9HYPH|nr:hypothetical protein [Mesorhizobium camelthorni]NGO53782.1 hypothetical protein [Mesorhizobium camelthorni]